MAAHLRPTLHWLLSDSMMQPAVSQYRRPGTHSLGAAVHSYSNPYLSCEIAAPFTPVLCSFRTAAIILHNLYPLGSVNSRADYIAEQHNLAQ